MIKPLLEIKNLNVKVDEKEILHNINLKINQEETHVLMGPNGAGKSTLGYALMGHPKYLINSGSILFDKHDITSESADKRAKDGMFLSFQSPIEVEGVSLESFIRSALKQKNDSDTRYWEFFMELTKNMELLNINKEYSDRDLNVGFSGGEKKKAEILQLLMLKPQLAILDETDSGLDVDAVKTVSKGIKKYQKEQKGALLIITHSTRVLEYLKVDYTHVMVDGRIVKTGDSSLINEINENGFEQFI